MLEILDQKAVTGYKEIITLTDEEVAIIDSKTGALKGICRRSHAAEIMKLMDEE